MANYDIYPVLRSIARLTGRTMDRKPSVITIKAIAGDTGLKQAQIKTILARNELALSKNDKGSLVGAKIVGSASDMGLVIQVREGVRGSTFWRQYYLKGEKIASVNMDTSDGRSQAERFDRDLPAEHGLPVCRTFAEVPDEIVKRVWDESLA